MLHLLPATNRLHVGVLSLGLVLLVLAEDALAAKRVAAPPATAPEVARFSFVGADNAHGRGVFVEPATIDRRQPAKVGFYSLYVFRDSSFQNLPRYERTYQVADCTYDTVQFLQSVSWTRYGHNGEVLGQSNKPDGERQAVPGSIDQTLWRQVCRDALPAPDSSDISDDIKTGVAAAVAFYAPMQEAADDLLHNGGVTAGPDAPGRALYLATRSKELAAISADDVPPLLADYERAANQGSHQAMWRLAILSNILKIDGDYDAWIRRLAEAGDALAQYSLAARLQSASPCGEARIWLQRAAEQGHVPAEAALGSWFEDGTCGPTDVSQAALWDEKAARNGAFLGQWRLGGLYARGLGVPQNVTEAAAWYGVAASHSPWESGLSLEDVDGAQMSLESMKGKMFLTLGWDGARDRARQLCREDKVCSLTAQPVDEAFRRAP